MFGTTKSKVTMVGRDSVVIKGRPTDVEREESVAGPP